MTLRLVCLVALLAGTLACASRRPEVPTTTHDGLQLVADPQIEAVYLKPGAEFAGYRRVAILECFVAFRKNWKRDVNEARPNPVTQRDMDRIKRELAAAFREVYVDELQTKGGYAVVTEGGEDVLVLRPAIIDLDVEAPDTSFAGPSRTYSNSAGSMTLVLELYDSVTSELLARAVDKQEARSSVMHLQAGAFNRAEAEQILRRWARILHERLDRVRARAAG
jgi:hypothetical protein